VFRVVFVPDWVIEPASKRTGCEKLARARPPRQRPVMTEASELRSEIVRVPLPATLLVQPAAFVEVAYVHCFVTVACRVTRNCLLLVRAAAATCSAVAATAKPTRRARRSPTTAYFACSDRERSGDPIR
jgi:hypothetical protein